MSFKCNWLAGGITKSLWLSQLWEPAQPTPQAGLLSAVTCTQRAASSQHPLWETDLGNRGLYHSVGNCPPSRKFGEVEEVCNCAWLWHAAGREQHPARQRGYPGTKLLTCVSAAVSWLGRCLWDKCRCQLLASSLLLTICSKFFYNLQNSCVYQGTTG